MVKRVPQFSINELFIKRWSPRAMSGQEISDTELMSLFEAARWAPSSYNNQPWRFIYAKRNTHHWDALFNLMGESNQSWTKNAALLVVIISKKTFEYNGKPSRTHSFDAGAAWENFALQGAYMNLVVHGMEGFDYERARKVLNIPEDYTIEAMAAVGKPGNIDVLSPEMQKREEPSDRKKVSELIFEGTFTARQQS